MSSSTATRTSGSTAVRLTRRGRGVLVLLLAAVLFGAFSIGRSAPQAAPVVDAGPSVVQQTVVQPGESLWSVARRIAPDNDPREVVSQIRRLNGLRDAQLQPGQQLLLPAVAA